MGGQERQRVLVVDDDPLIVRAATRLLGARGFLVTGVSGVPAALMAMNEYEFDVILSDIQMPEMSGIDFLRAVRGRNLDIPVLLMTGDPSLATAMNAVEYGAFGYVVKPLDTEALTKRLERAAALHSLAKLKRQALELAGVAGMDLGDVASLEARFENALIGLWLAFQPIVDSGSHGVVSYEALVRSDEPTLARPDDLLRTAERLGRLDDLGRAIRRLAARSVSRIPEHAALFVNLHPRDLRDPDLFGDECPLHEVAQRVVLEITERASLADVDDVAGRVRKLRVRGYRIAVDDLGAGYAGLSSFTQLEPDIVKLDMSLVRGVDGHGGKRRIVRAMVRLCKQLGISVVGEGVETPGERDVMVQLGCDWLQGFLFARPNRELPDVSW